LASCRSIREQQEQDHDGTHPQPGKEDTTTIVKRANQRQPPTSSSLSIQTIQSNPFLAKLLVRAKRQKQQEDFAKQQASLDERIDAFLAEQSDQTSTVQNVIDHVIKDRGSNRPEPSDLKGLAWPTNAMDVHVHIHQRCRKGRWRIHQSHSDEQQLGKLVEEHAQIGL
jgi:hypothetical protein